MICTFTVSNEWISIIYLFFYFNQLNLNPSALPKVHDISGYPIDKCFPEH